jgi:hypothetical protein
LFYSALAGFFSALLMPIDISGPSRVLAVGPDSPSEAIAIMAADPDHLLPAAEAPEVLALLPVRNTSPAWCCP